MPPSAKRARTKGRKLREANDAAQAELERHRRPRPTRSCESIPNLSHPDAPVGGDDKANLEIRRGKHEPPKFDFKPLDHVELGEKLGLFDFEGGAKVAGHGFYFLKNDAVLLELALQHYALDVLMGEGFTPTITPDLARNEILQGTGFIPRGPETQIYSIADSDLSLVATAEITLGGLLAGEILEAEQLADQALRHQPLLPHRSRRRRPGLARAVPRASVHQGRDVRLHAARAERRDARLLLRPGMPDLRRPGHSLPRGRHGHRRPGRAGLSQVRPRSLDARPRRRRANMAKSPAPRTAPTTKPAGSDIRYRNKGEKGTHSSTRSTAPPSPSAGRSSPCWKTISRPTARSSCPKCCARGWAKIGLRSGPRSHRIRPRL